MSKFKAKSESSKIIWHNLFRNWAHQSFFYLDRTEKIARLLLEILVTTVLVISVAGLTDISAASPWLWLAGFLVTHTIIWIFNTNFWACLMFALPSLRNPGAETTCRYLNSIGSRLTKKQSISGILIYGSVSRGEWHNKSDLDIRVLRQPGFINGINATLIVVKERLIAAFKRQPLDLYLADNMTFLNKMRADEVPVFLLKRCDALEERYPGLNAQVFKIRDLIRSKTQDENT